jgi:hypothetical protein
MYQVTVRDIAERFQIITDKAAAATERERFYQLTSGPADLPVVNLELGVPLYRLANYRTQTRQMAHVRSLQLAPEFFRLGQENVSAQQAQHDILVEFAKLGSGESIIPIYDVLKSGRQQTDSLLITGDGVVVNGNRRLAAMRELYEAEPEGYTSFASVRARVLPASLTAIEIKRIEARLQMTPQTLLPYDWVNEALAIRDLKTFGLSDAEIAAEMKLGDPEAVNDKLAQLGEAELFLAEYLHTPLQYEKVMDQQQQFFELRKALDRTKDAVDKELARKISYVITHNSENLGRRAYDYRIAYGSELRKVVTELSDRLGVPIVDEADDNSPSDDLLNDGTSEIQKFAPLIEQLSDINHSQPIASEIAEICNNIRESQQKQNLSSAALRKATKAHTLLTEITLDTAAPTTLPSISAQLQSILDRATDLLNAVNERHSAS